MYKHKIDSGKLNFMKQSLEVIIDSLNGKDGLREEAASNEAHSVLNDLIRWEKSDGIVPAEITQACISMEEVIPNLKDEGGLRSMARDVIQILMTEEHEANHMASLLPDRDLKPEDYEFIVHGISTEGCNGITEETIYKIIDAALGGAQYIEDLTSRLIEEIRKVEFEDAEINTGIFREGLFAISDAIDEMETLLFNPSKIHKAEIDTAARHEEIENAAQRLFFMDIPKIMEEGFIEIEEGLKEDLPFN